MSTSSPTQAFGIDIGGSGIKGAPVDLQRGELAAERHRIPTPQPSLPDAVADTVSELISSFDVPAGMPVGVTFPAVIQQGVAQTAANVDDSWIGTDVDALLTERTGHDVFVVNDADAAGIAEMTFGAGQGVPGVVIVVTLGTGVGSAMFVDGTLVPNSELGHLTLHGAAAERYMASSAREREELDWDVWAGRLQEYFSMVEFLFSPTRIIVGGGVSKKHEKFLPLLDLKTEIVPAQLRNEAGIIGAAALASQEEHHLLAQQKKAAKQAKKAAKLEKKKAKESAKGEKKSGKKTGKA
ncbi:polyphosphate--glucose phosphotransferase [Brachybacterium sp. UMB0905]|uniref:polyphosphate--glucose phosphotransferase n=1 Tax=Brachybacterium sp. UMB0905 TaxID=2069310 RepID=UPI000C7F9EE1|nr:ROK family protein [Brachybacterium sp. UMB0905]PMC75371.1 polyphosphate glucokinase [Brachybacterium sp. UMB0905]